MARTTYDLYGDSSTGDGWFKVESNENDGSRLLVNSIAVTDTATFRGAQAVTGDMTVGGTLGVTGELTQTAAATFNGPVTVSANDTLTVTGPAAFGDTVTFSDNIAGAITFTGPVTVQGNDTTTITGPLTCGDTATFSDAVTMSSTLGVTGAITASKITAAAQTTFNGPVLFAAGDSSAATFTGLGADSTGLSLGQLYSNSGVLTIAQG